jgi:hypothetical protein
VRVGFLDPSLPGSGLDLLSVEIDMNGTMVADMSFTDAASAEAALDDHVITVDPSVYATSFVPTLEIHFSGHSTGAIEGFLSNFVVLAHVPEPFEAVLVAVGACLLGLARRRMHPACAPRRV